MNKEFGAFAPSAFQQKIMGFTRSLPDTWLGRRMGFALRKLVHGGRQEPIDTDVFGLKMRLHPQGNKCEKRVICLPQFFDPEERRILEEFANDYQQFNATPPPTDIPEVNYINEHVADEVAQTDSCTNPTASEPIGNNEVFKEVNSEGAPLGNIPKDCFPKDQLAPEDLLPSDPNSTWAQVNPAGQGEVGAQNFLTAGYHVGVNTVGQTLRNANQSLRSDPPNPQVKVSPWNQTTIEPDTNRRGLEIGGDICN